MAINRISGNILQDNLQRGANLAIQGNLVFFDIVNNRVGISTETPGAELEVGGNLQVGNVVVYAAGNVDVGNVWINNLQSPVANLDAATKLYVDQTVGNIELGNFSFSNTTISTTISPANITLAPTGNSEVIIDTTSGLVIPVGTTDQRPTTPVTGTLRWNTDLQRAEIYDGTEWDQVASDVSAQLITPDGSSLAYTLDRITTAAAVLIITNGIVQTPAVTYTVTGNVLTFVEAPLTTDVIDVRFI
jgi:hypothetical protein